MSALVVVGDTLLDRDIDGTAERVCPESPALVLAEEDTVDRPGGAGLAALLAAGRGHQVTLITALADDPAGARLAQLLTGAGIQLCRLSLPGTTDEKIRLRAAGRVLLRLDRGGGGRPGGPLPADALAALQSAEAVLVSDYGRGMSRLPELRAALAGVAAPVVWDPHPQGAPAIAGTRLVTPNEPELAALTGRGRPAREEGSRRLAALAHGADTLRRQWRVGAVAVTLGPDGALLSHAGPTPLVVPVPVSTEGDTCGAGDRFAAAAVAGLAAGALVSEAVQVAVTEAAGYVASGAARVVSDRPPPVVPASTGDGATGELIAEVRARAGTVVATGGCFDLLHAGHVATLEAARGLGDCLVVCINSDVSVARLKGPGRPLVSQADRVRLLAALGCVDAVVVFDEPSPEATLSRLRPDIWVKGGDYAGGTPDTPDLPEAELVGGWGGQTVIVPYLAGRSTTGMIAAVRRNGAGSRYRRAGRPKGA
jgi:rfaE bifunctional protein nucleotidyltransferase chain/domain